MVHSLPVLMNIVSNLLLRSLNVTESIQIWSNPLVQVSSSQKITLGHWGEGRASLGGRGTAETPHERGKSWVGLPEGFKRCGRCFLLCRLWKERKKGAWEEELKVGWGLEQEVGMR